MTIAASSLPEETSRAAFSASVSRIRIHSSSPIDRIHSSVTALPPSRLTMPTAIDASVVPPPASMAIATPNTGSTK